MTPAAELSSAICRAKGEANAVCHRFTGHKGRHVGFDPNDPKSPMVTWEEPARLEFKRIAGEP